MKCSAAALSVILLVGCATPQTFVLDKPGFTQAQFERDRAKCEFEAEKVKATVDWRTTNTVVVYNQILRKCMAAEGYTERPQ